MVSESWLLFWDGCLDASGLELCPPSATLDMRYSWNAERLTSEKKIVVNALMSVVSHIEKNIK
jgi:hypothetical protein